MIGAALDAWMLVPGWVRGKTQPEEAGVTLETVVDHIDRVCQLAGNARHAAHRHRPRRRLRHASSRRPTWTPSPTCKKSPTCLRRRGYPEADVAAVFHGNWLRFFREHLPAD